MRGERKERRHATATPSRPEIILLATDLSSRCDRALDRAAQLSLDWGARLVALHVLAPESELRSFSEEHHLHSWRRPSQPLAIAERQLRMSLAERAERVTTLVEEGDPAESIARVAAARGCGLIVTGTARDESLARMPPIECRRGTPAICRPVWARLPLQTRLH